MNAVQTLGGGGVQPGPEEDMPPWARPARRRRVGVAVLVDPPVATEIDGLRRALGDPGLGRIGPHITLVPPVNIRAGELPLVLATLRQAASRHRGPFRLSLGGVATFWPDNPVVYLQVAGDLERLRQTRDEVFSGPLRRRLSWPWVAHLTLADGIAPERIPAALSALEHYTAVVEVDRVVLLEEGRQRVWAPLGDALLGPAARVGTGGLTIELSAGRVPDPEVWAEIAGSVPTAANSETLPGRTKAAAPSRPKRVEAANPPARAEPVLFVAARREGRPAGLSGLWRRDDGGLVVSVAVVEGCRRQGVGTALLARLETLAHAEGLTNVVAVAAGDGGWYRSRTAWLPPPG